MSTEVRANTEVKMEAGEYPAVHRASGCDCPICKFGDHSLAFDTLKVECLEWAHLSIFQKVIYLDKYS